MLNQQRKTLPEVEREKIVDLANKVISSDEGKDVINYLKSPKRHFDDTGILMLINKFKIGYIPQHVLNCLGNKHEFAGRIIFPIYDQYNTLVALSSRDWRNLSSMPFLHESFLKSNILYGLNVSKNSILENKKAIIVEGEFDTQYLHSRGFNFTVGVLGSAVSLNHIALLSRYCREIFLIFDGDKTGKSSTEKTIKMSKKIFLEKMYNISVIPVYLPENEDPDDFLYKNGDKEFNNLLMESRKKYENDLR